MKGTFLFHPQPNFGNHCVSEITNSTTEACWLMGIRLESFNNTDNLPVQKFVFFTIPVTFYFFLNSLGHMRTQTHTHTHTHTRKHTRTHCVFVCVCVCTYIKCAVQLLVVISDGMIRHTSNILGFITSKEILVTDIRVTSNLSLLCSETDC
jgi:hypothetical protein